MKGVFGILMTTFSSGTSRVIATQPMDWTMERSTASRGMPAGPVSTETGVVRALGRGCLAAKTGKTTKMVSRAATKRLRLFMSFTPIGWKAGLDEFRR